MNYYSIVRVSTYDYGYGDNGNFSDGAIRISTDEPISEALLDTYVGHCKRMYGSSVGSTHICSSDHTIFYIVVEGEYSALDVDKLLKSLRGLTKANLEIYKLFTNIVHYEQDLVG